MNTNVKGGLIALGIGGVIVGLMFALNRQAKGSTPQPVPLTPTTVSNLKTSILSAGDLSALNGYFINMGGYLDQGQITTIEYDELYTAYVKRFYQLTGVST